MTFSKGSKVRLQVTFVDVAGVVVDPDLVFLQYIAPGAAVVTKTYPADITRVSVGVYRIDLDATASGRWDWRWYSTGSGQAADEGFFLVSASAF